MVRLVRMENPMAPLLREAIRNASEQKELYQQRAVEARQAGADEMANELMQHAMRSAKSEKSGESHLDAVMRKPMWFAEELHKPEVRYINIAVGIRIDDAKYWKNLGVKC